ncbi:MAG: PAS domain-containing protein, partial [Candidatus Rokuibacteriota bacterium]
MTDLERTIRWANAALALQPPIEHGASQWPGQSCRSLCRRWTQGRDDTSCEICPIAKAIGTREIAHGEYHPPNGEGVNTLYLTALPISGPDGTPYEIMVTVQDLSDLDVLRKSESRYRALFERSSDALLIVDPHTHCVLFANAAAGRLFACPESEMQGMPLRELHASSEWARLEEHYRAMFTDAEASEGFEATVRTSRGELRAGKVRASKIDLDGRPASLVQVRDVTESRRVRQALAVAEERLRVVVANSPVVLFALDADGVFTLSEGMGLQALGLAPGEVVGRSVFEVYKGVPQIHENIRRALSGEEFTEVVTVGTLAFETRYTPMRDASQAVVGLIGVSTDVSERRTLEDR